jgi:hypothetical protein
MNLDFFSKYPSELLMPLLFRRNLPGQFCLGKKFGGGLMNNLLKLLIIIDISI